ncbi:MAG: isopentenyl-diphosphate Delta-isomerase [Chitinophagaceae bacterium]|nr:MAG: isopentenyl-diphosphate Delta-isomerase [Chitinophagaceae bacterium]
MSEVILVNQEDESIGTMEKMQAHREGLLHRAFSIFIFNSDGDMLIQQRAASKYHSAGLWTNACCSHPLPGEETAEAAKRRLMEEMGFVTGLEKIFVFTYRTEFDNGLTEHEVDHVFIGTYEGEIKPDPEEVDNYAYLSMDAIRLSMIREPHLYTSWFKIAFPKLETYLAATGV